MLEAPVSALTDDAALARRLAAFLHDHPGLLVVTGAGLSTASGIPDYRDRDGVRRGRAPIQGPAFRAEAAVRRRYWARSMAGWPLMSAAAPNDGHRALARLQQAGVVGHIVTQNVDGLHRQAGSTRLIELHGDLHRVVCLACGERQARAAIQEALVRLNPQHALSGGSAMPVPTAAPDGDAHVEPDAEARFHVPDCPACGGVLQPDVVFFGDLVPRRVTLAAEQAIDEAPAVLAVGSSLMVHSAFRLCRMAAEAGKPVAALNLGKTRADGFLHFKLDAPAEALLARAAALLGVEA